MHRTARILDSLDRLQRRLRRRATVAGLSNDRSGRIVDRLVADGWDLRAWRESAGSAGAARSITLRRKWRTVRLQWDRWSDWRLDGPRDLVEEIAGAPGSGADGRVHRRRFDVEPADAVPDA